jgi:myo-inositol-1(or 4)-monophosphatase
MTDIDARQAFAIEIVQQAGHLARSMRDRLPAVDAKSAIDFCTEADREVEKLIRAEVAKRFGDSFIGEEFGGEAGDAVWVVDPIDGTASYIHGTPRWCVSMGFVLDGVIEIGAIYAPVPDELFVARRRNGATLNGYPIRISGLKHGAAPVVETGWSERRPLETYFEVLRQLTAARYEFRRIGSGALGLADVACGRSDGYLELHINAWDALAGLLLVTEAGGCVNDFLADGGLHKGNLVLACTPEIASTLTDIASGSGQSGHEGNIAIKRNEPNIL